MFDKVLVFLLESPAGKRIVRALVDRALVAGVTVLLSWLALDPDAAKVLNADLLAVANTLAPWIVTALFGYLAVRKANRTELTIETAAALDRDTPRDVIETVAAQLAKRKITPENLRSAVPPGTVDRTD